MSPARSAPLTSPRLRRLAQREAAPAAEQPEICELCGEGIPAQHRHLLDLGSRQLLCSCRACAILFDRSGAGAGNLRLVPERRLHLTGWELSDLAWEELRIPVEMAFFTYNTQADRVIALYPGPMGATESQLELETWQEIERAHPLLARMEPDVEALLVNRARGLRGQWLVPIEDPYRLVALIRTRWRGLSGGKEVWMEIERFFEDLDRRARPAPATAAAAAERR